MAERNGWKIFTGRLIQPDDAYHPHFRRPSWPDSSLHLRLISVSQYLDNRRDLPCLAPTKNGPPRGDAKGRGDAKVALARRTWVYTFCLLFLTVGNRELGETVLGRHGEIGYTSFTL
jgi:hypothetical protein